MKKVFVKRYLSLSLILLMVLLSVTACGSKATQGTNTDPQKPQSGGILRISNTAEGASSLGVPWEVALIDTLLLHPMYESLVREDTTGKIHPYLATEWKVELEKKQVVFTLRKDVKFHDGTAFNAEAARWNLQKWIDSKQAPGVTGVKVIDEFTVALTFETYANSLLNRAASRIASMISPTAYEKNGIEWARKNPVGTGPFKFESYTRGESLKFVKNDSYWVKDRPYLDGVQYQFIKDQMTQQTAMLVDGPQSIDILNTTSPEQASTLKTKGLTIATMPIGPFSLMPDSMNADSPLSKQKVREAISYAIDREGIVAARGFGVWTPAYQFVPEGGWEAHIPGFKGTTLNVDKAKQLLTEAGYPNGFKTTIFGMPGMSDKDTLVAIQSQLGKVGIQVTLEFPDSGGYNNLVVKGWNNGMLGQHTRVLPNFNSSYSIYFLNPTQMFSMKRTDGLIDLINKSLITATPDKTGQAVNKMIADDSMFIPIVNYTDNYIMKTTVHDTGFTKWGSGTGSRLDDAWLSKK